MSIKVRFLANIRDLIGKAEIDLQMDAAAQPTARDVLMAVLEVHYAGDDDDMADNAMVKLWDAVPRYVEAREKARRLPNPSDLARYLNPVTVGGELGSK